MYATDKPWWPMCSYLYQTSGSSGPHADFPIGAWPCGLQRSPAEASSRNTALAMALATFACGRLLPALPDSICLASHICIEQAPSEANHLTGTVPWKTSSITEALARPLAQEQGYICTYAC